MKKNYSDGLEFLIKKHVCVLTEMALQQRRAPPPADGRALSGNPRKICQVSKKIGGIRNLLLLRR